MIKWKKKIMTKERALQIKNEMKVQIEKYSKRKSRHFLAAPCVVGRPTESL